MSKWRRLCSTAGVTSGAASLIFGLAAVLLVNPVAASAQPAPTFVFGDQVAGTASASMTATIPVPSGGFTGGQTGFSGNAIETTISVSSVTGAFNIDFNGCAASDVTCSITATFNPATIGSFTYGFDQLVCTATGVPCNDVPVTFTGTGIPVPTTGTMSLSQSSGPPGTAVEVTSISPCPIPVTTSIPLTLETSSGSPVASTTANIVDQGGDWAGTLTIPGGTPSGNYLFHAECLNQTVIEQVYTFQNFAVSDVPTSTVIISSANPASYGQAVTFAATVFAPQGAGVPAGTVTFSDGSFPLGTAPLQGGNAILSGISNLPVGTNLITASYNGNGPFEASNSSVLTQDVQAAPTTIALAASANPSSFGQAVTFTANVTSSYGSGAPTGTVTFRDGSVVLATEALSSGSAVLPGVSGLAPGTSQITATYNGSSDYLVSQSASLSQVVNRAATTLSAVTAGNPSLLHYTLSATLRRSFDGASLGGQTVVFSYEGKNVCTATTSSSGIASCTFVGIGIPNTNYTATYGGNAGYLPSTGTAKI